MAPPLDAVIKALRIVPLEAVPATLDAVILATGTPTSALLSSLIDVFLGVFQVMQRETSGRIDVVVEAESNFLRALMTGLLHLFKECENNKDELSKLIWTIYMPLLQNTIPHVSALHNLAAQMIAEMFIAKGAWDYAKTALIPYFLKSLEIAISCREPESEVNYKWNFVYHECFANDKNIQNIDVHDEEKLCSHIPLKINVLCQLVAALLLAASNTMVKGEFGKELMAAHQNSFAQDFCRTAVSSLFTPALSMFSQANDAILRHYAIKALIPPLLKVANGLPSSPDFAKTVSPKKSRKSIMKEVWLGCKTLLSLGSTQRRDAFMALALFSDFLLPSASGWQHGADEDKLAEFDVRLEFDFWDALKGGLVDEDSLTRKRSLHVLKMALQRLLKSEAADITTIKIQDDLIQSGKGRDNNSHDHLLSKRERWAHKEALSLGMGVPKEVLKISPDRCQRWDAFMLLYDILEEYGTHLVEAAWTFQLSIVLPVRKMGDSNDKQTAGWSLSEGNDCLDDVTFLWTTVLWQRGFKHKNPQVRRLVMQSFLELEWDEASNISVVVPESFILGPFLSALNDPIHHKEFGVKGVYTSETARRAAEFIQLYSASLCSRVRACFVVHMAKITCSTAFCRAGLMTLAICIEAAAGSPVSGESFVEKEFEKLSVCLNGGGPDGMTRNADDQGASEEVLESLWLLVEDCKRHFNPNYRSKVCSHVLRAASALVLSEVTFRKFALFLSSFPYEFLVFGGRLHGELLSWLESNKKIFGSLSSVKFKNWMNDGLLFMAESFLKPQMPLTTSELSDDEVEAWKAEAERWSRLVFIGILEAEHLAELVMFVEQHSFQIYQRPYNSACVPEKVLLLLNGLIKKCPYQPSSAKLSSQLSSMPGKTRHGALPDSFLTQLHSVVLSTLGELVSHAGRAVSVFWDHDHSSSRILPISVTGKLGGPSQRRLPAITASAVLKAVLAVSTVADCVIWLCQVADKKAPECAPNFLWEFAWNVVTSPFPKEEIEAEIQLAAYEALASVCKALSATCSLHMLAMVRATGKVEGMKANRPVDAFLLNFLEGVNSLLQTKFLARGRRAVLLQQKWCCLDSLLSITQKSVDGEFVSSEPNGGSAMSDSTLKVVLHDAIVSLESAGEENLLPLLRSVRWLMEWDILHRLNTDNSIGKQEEVQIVWSLVKSAWAAMADCNKRKVAPMAAFLSAALHPNIFGELSMHGYGEDGGPFKWLLGRLIEQGSRSPRTMHLTAMHVTGLWCQFPAVAEFYIQEMKLLSLHGGEAIDEEMDGEILESQVAANEYLCLMQSSDPELVEEFTNSEMSVRVTVAVLVHKFAQIVTEARLSGRKENIETALPAASCGRMLLLELLNSAVKDTDLNKELYKKKSAIHRKKVRAWQMICILSHFVNDDMLEEVMQLLETCLYRNNMPSVRQFIETFAVQIYLKFPHLVKEHLLQVLLNYDMKSQALASYVFIAANVLSHITPESLQMDLLQDLLPAVLPYLTTHHHNLRSFSQILIFRILHNILKISATSQSLMKTSLPLEKKCLHSVVSYLELNTDCKRMRVSVEKFLSLSDPFASSTPRGIFTMREGEEDPCKTLDNLPFECVPVALMDHITNFLNDAREDLRDSMAADAIALMNEELTDQVSRLHGARYERQSQRPIVQPEITLPMSLAGSSCIDEGSWDFQKKISSLRFTDDVPSTLKERHGSTMQRNGIESTISVLGTEEELLDTAIDSRVKDLAMMRGGRQDMILVASLLGRIPNLAGLARTCEVFKVASLVVADASIVQDRQFQLISVTAEMWVPLKEVPEASLHQYLEGRKKLGYSLVGLEQTANSISLDEYVFPNKTVLVLGREKEGIPVDIIQALDTCVEIPQLGVIRSLNVHVSGAIAVWEYTRQQRNKQGLLAGKPSH